MVKKIVFLTSVDKTLNPYAKKKKNQRTWNLSHSTYKMVQRLKHRPNVTRVPKITGINLCFLEPKKTFRSSTSSMNNKR